MALISMTLSDLWPTLQGHDHSLNGSSENVYGDLQFLWESANFNSPQNRYPWTDQQKSQHNWLRPRQDPVYQIWYKSTHWTLLGKWVKYKKYFLFIPFFSGSRTGQIRGWIFTRDSSKDVKSRKDVPFGGLNDVPLNFGGKPPKLKFWGRE